MSAARNQQALKHTIRLFSSSSRSGKEGISSDELDESEVIWASLSPPQAPGPWPAWKKTADGPACPGAVGSLPVNIPGWSKIRSRAFEEDEAEEEEEQGEVLPPHELVWRRRRVESFSVVEGIGRTLKGRDLSRVRNAVWAQTGFQD